MQIAQPFFQMGPEVSLGVIYRLQAEAPSYIGDYYPQYSNHTSIDEFRAYANAAWSGTEIASLAEITAGQTVVTGTVSDMFGSSAGAIQVEGSPAWFEFAYEDDSIEWGSLSIKTVTLSGQAISTKQYSLHRSYDGGTTWGLLKVLDIANSTAVQQFTA